MSYTCNIMIVSLPVIPQIIITLTGVALYARELRGYVKNKF